MRVLPVPALRDNYAYLLIDDSAHEAVVIDPSEKGPVLDALEAEGVRPVAIWLTHHHWDHVGGISGLRDCFGDLPVLGSRYDLEHGRIEAQSVGLTESSKLDFAGHAVRVLEIPGHTLGAIAYLIDGNLFSGDTLFLSGCGRLFEGTPAQMADSLARLRELPAKTKIWCGHEYTAANLRFAQHVEPDNEHTAQALKHTIEQRERGEPSVPWTLEQDARVNPFLRFDTAGLQGEQTAHESFAALRARKDKF